jgi:hypothetical protein
MLLSGMVLFIFKALPGSGMVPAGEYIKKGANLSLSWIFSHDVPERIFRNIFSRKTNIDDADWL